jgi:hypothetical protein
MFSTEAARAIRAAIRDNLNARGGGVYLVAVGEPGTRPDGPSGFTVPHPARLMDAKASRGAAVVRVQLLESGVWHECQPGERIETRPGNALVVLIGHTGGEIAGAPAKAVRL